MDHVKHFRFAPGDPRNTGEAQSAENLWGRCFWCLAKLNGSHFQVETQTGLLFLDTWCAQDMGIALIRAAYAEAINVL